MSLLETAVIEEHLRALNDWHREGSSIVRDYAFTDFRESMEFVNTVAERAEAAGHHPDIDIRYNKVRLRLTSHDAGGITQRDLDLARAIDAVHS